MHQTPRIVFFGTPHIAVGALEQLHVSGLTPYLVVTNPDRPQGRKMVLTSPPAKVWADNNHIPVLQPESLKNSDVIETLQQTNADLFVVVAYGNIIPEAILAIPKHGTLNLHPSLLSKLRGASPIRSAILENMRETGVTIMLLDEEMDHGPILAQREISIPEEKWPMRGQELDSLLAEAGAVLLAETVPKLLDGTIKPREQNHETATYCKKITKEMGEINLEDDPYQNLLKIRAFDGWPGTYFFMERSGKKMRIKIVDAELAEDGTLKILRVIPEGKKEIAYTEFMKQ